MEKCKWFLAELEIVGYTVGRHVITSSHKIVQAITDMALPRSLTQLKSFLGLCNYFSAHVAGYANRMSALYNKLTKAKQGELDEWSTEETAAFDGMKQTLATGPVRVHADPNANFHLETDASSTAVLEPCSPAGLGGLLLQRTPSGEPHLIAAYSCTLTKAEKNAHVTILELTAITNCLAKFSAWLHGSGRTIVITDHEALKYLLDQTTWSPKISRMALQLIAFQRIHVLFGRQGDRHCAVDSLSRMARLPVPSCHPAVTMADLLSPRMSGAEDTVTHAPDEFFVGAVFSSRAPRFPRPSCGHSR